MNSILIFDIETKPTNYKDEKKIKEYTDKKREGQDKEMSLDFDYCKICVLGMSFDFNSPEHTILTCETREEEVKALEEFWKQAEYSTLFGYNIANFDLPIILRRSWQLNVYPSRKFKPKYDPDIIDLMQLLYPYPAKWKGLKKVCEIYGIQIPCPDVDGSMVKNMTKEQLIQYCASDITITQQLAKKMTGYYF